MSFVRAEWYGSETSTTRVSDRSFKNRAAAARDCHDERPVVSRRIARSGTSCAWRYDGARRRLGEAVTGLLAPRDDDHRRDAAAVQLDRRGRDARRAPSTAGRRTGPRRAPRSRRRDVRRRAATPTTPARRSPRSTTKATANTARAMRHAHRQRAHHKRARARAEPGEGRLAAEQQDRVEQGQALTAAFDRRVEDCIDLARLQAERLDDRLELDRLDVPLAARDVRDHRVEDRRRLLDLRRASPTTRRRSRCSSSGVKRNAIWSAICTSVVARTWASSTAGLEARDVDAARRSGPARTAAPRRAGR